MDCQLCQIEIEEIERGESLSSDAAVHLSTCEKCRTSYTERQSLRKLCADLEPVSAPADFDFRLRARLAAGNGRQRSSWHSFVFSAPAIGLAASLLVLGVAAIAIYKRSAPQPKASAQAGDVARQKSEQPRQTTTVNPAASGNNQGTSPELAEKRNSDSITESPGKIERQPHLTSGKAGQRRSQPPATNLSGQGFSNELAGRSAPVITPYGGTSSPIVGASPLMEVSVRSKSQPLTISLDERGGVKRTVTLEPVIFGSQDLTGRETSRVVASNGIW